MMDNLPYTVTIDEMPEKSLVRFSGQLIINHIERITGVVKDGLNASKDLQIEIERPESVDVTFMQLVLAIKATLAANGKKVVVKSELNDELTKMIQNSGFQYVIN
ncbi:hypothetical protein [Carboxylicivirga taeanensis]|uniref:hypothetical protein n=1 Tax=Carboxylicivirga taeanensis TaxID=1416875 RepID=UPI003F6E33F2